MDQENGDNKNRLKLSLPASVVAAVVAVVFADSSWRVVSSVDDKPDRKLEQLQTEVRTNLALIQGHETQIQLLQFQIGECMKRVYRE